jgi:hypothetical protein
MLVVAWFFSSSFFVVHDGPAHYLRCIYVSRLFFSVGHFGPPLLPTSRSLPFCTRKTRMKFESLPTLFLLIALIADAHCLMRNPFYATLRRTESSIHYAPPLRLRPSFLTHCAAPGLRAGTTAGWQVRNSNVQAFLPSAAGARRDAGLRLGNGGLFSLHFESLHSFSCLVFQPKLPANRSRYCLRCMTLWLFLLYHYWNAYIIIYRWKK